MTRCDFCGRVLSDPESIKAGRGRECLDKTSTPRSQRLDALRRIVDRNQVDAPLAAQILRRMEHAQALTVRMYRFSLDAVAGRPAPGDPDYSCLCAAPEGQHAAFCQRAQRPRAVEAT